MVTGLKAPPCRDRAHHALTFSTSLVGLGVADGQLLAWFAARDVACAEPAFAELVRRYGPMVLGTCRQYLRNSHDAEDAFQATFLVLARKAGSIQRPEQLSCWLYGVAIRVAQKVRFRNNMRARHEVQELAMAMAEPGGQDLRMIRREEIAALHEELVRLPEKYRLPIVLCDLGGLAHVEAARRLHWPSGSLSVRLMRARELLRGRLTRRGLAPSSTALIAIAALSEAARATVAPAMSERAVRTAMGRLTSGSGGVGAAVGSVASLADQVLVAMARTKLMAVSATLFGGLFAVVVAWLVLLGASTGEARPRGSSVFAEAGIRLSDRAPDGPRRPLEGGKATQEEAPGVEPAEPGRPLTAPVAPPATPSLPGGALGSYEDRVKHAGGDVDSQVRLALWCEANGLVAERLKHLVLAVMLDPNQPTARGLLGQIAFRGRWRRPEEVGALLGDDTRFATALRAYEVRRDALEYNAEAHWRLALWCERNGLESEAQAHLVTVTRRDPGRDAAWRRLGYRKSHGRWLKPEQIAAEATALEVRKAADHAWRSRFTKWKTALQDDAKRPWAEVELAQVADPLAVPAIWVSFAQGGPASQILAARLLGQVEGADASRGLAFLAVLGHSAEVRRLATEILSRRDPRDVVDLLIDRIAEPIKYEVRSVQGPGMPGSLFVEGEEFNLRRFYTVPPLPEHTIRRMIDPMTPPNYLLSMAPVLGEDWVRQVSLPVMDAVFRNNVNGVRCNLAIAARATEVAQRRLVDDTRVIMEYNQAVAENNERIEVPLRTLTGQDHGHDRESWRAWWTDQKGYAYVPLQSSSSTPKPTVEQEIPLPYRPIYKTLTGMSCFGAGTQIQTRQGERSIDAIRVGDVVLTQDPTSGALSYAPVLAVFHNKPTPTLRIRLGDEVEPIVATGIHRFWVSGKGWAMARDLKPGDPIRTLGGQVQVASVSLGPSEPVFNLEVAENQSFFAGRARALVHDNSLVEPVTQPFDGLADRLALAPAR